MKLYLTKAYFVLSVGNVLSGAYVSVLLGQTEINQKQFVTVTTNSHQKVVRLKK